MSKQQIPVLAGAKVSGPRQMATASAPVGSTLNIRDVMAIIMQRIWMIVIVTVAGAVIGMVLWGILRKYSPSYMSQALIECKMPIAPDLLKGTQLMPQAAIIELETQSKATYLRNRMFLAEALRNRTVIQETQWFQRYGSDALEELIGNFGAHAQRDSEYVVASMRAGGALEAQTILNEILREFGSRMEDQATRELRQQLAALKRQRLAISSDKDNTATRLETISGDVRVPGWEKARTVVSDDLMTLSQEKRYLAHRITKLRLQETQIAGYAESGQISGLVQMQIDQDNMVLSHKSRISGLQEELDKLFGRFGPEHRQVQEMVLRMESNENALTELQERLGNQYAAAQLSSIQLEIASTEQELERIEMQYDEVNLQQLDIDRKLSQYSRIKDEMDALTAQLAGIDSRIYSTNVQIVDPDRVRARVAIWGNLPEKISFPLWYVFLAGGIVLGLMASVGLTFLLEFLDDTIKSPRDLVQHLSLSPLGMVPLYDEAEAGVGDVGRISSTYPKAIISEFYRQFKANFCSSVPAEQQKSILVTSCAAGCGKTVTVSNLSAVLALQGRKVLLIDGNQRRPGLQKLFKIDSESGLGDVLEGSKAGTDVICHTDIKGLDVICAGKLLENPADALNSKAMHDLVESQKLVYDHVIIDGPPSLLVTDARILANVVDSVLFVISASDTSRGIAQRMIREMRGVNAHIAGVLLNRVKPRRGGYLLKSYQSYYDYVGKEGVSQAVAAV